MRMIALCEEGKAPSAEAIEAFVPDEAFDQERADWVARLLEPLEQIAQARKSP